MISEFISNIFSAIDDDLTSLQNKIESGRCSDRDILDYIEEIRDRL